MASFKAIKTESLKELVKDSDNVQTNMDRNRLNDKVAKAKLVKVQVMLYIKVKDDKTCKVDTTTIKIASVDLGTDAGGNHTDTKVVFYAEKDKVVYHLYNTT